MLSLGVSSTEVAAVGLVALAAGDAALALGALAGSLIAAATVGPVLIGLLADTDASADTGALLGRFALVVLLPLAAGIAARAAWPRLARGEPWFAAGSTLAVVVLIYAALSGSNARDDLLPALAASAAFLALSAIPALAAARLVRPDRRSTVAFAVALRDFAVAATLATQAFGAQAATVGGIYGVLMLIAGALATAALGHRERPTKQHRSATPEHSWRTRHRGIRNGSHAQPHNSECKRGARCPLLATASRIRRGCKQPAMPCHFQAAKQRSVSH